jgi:hypothetical protein
MKQSWLRLHTISNGNATNIKSNITKINVMWSWYNEVQNLYKIKTIFYDEGLLWDCIISISEWDVGSL